MAYSKQGFANGNVLDASQLIAMEDGILANEEAIGQFQRGLDVYSVEETVIGTWIDGKPLYRITLSITSPSAVKTNTNVYYTTELSIDQFLDLTGVLIHPNVTVKLPYASNEDYYISVTYDNTNQAIIMRIGATTYADKPCFLTIWYTKTTDEQTVAVASSDELDEAYGEGVQSA